MKTLRPPTIYLAGGGTAIRRFREEVGISLNDCARDGMCSKDLLSRYETNKRRVTLETVLKLAKYFGVDPMSMVSAMFKEMAVESHSPLIKEVADQLNTMSQHHEKGGHNL